MSSAAVRVGVGTRFSYDSEVAEVAVSASMRSWMSGVLVLGGNGPPHVVRLLPTERFVLPGLLILCWRKGYRRVLSNPATTRAR